MPATSTLPLNNIILRFPGSSASARLGTTNAEAGPSRLNGSSNEGDEADAEVEETYQLLELPAEILKRVQASTDGTPFPLTIKGKPSDDAVLCTPDSTYLLRTVDISNSLLICRPPPGGGDTNRPTLEIRDVSHHVLEPVSQAPNLERLRTVLRASAWQGINDETMANDSDEDMMKDDHRARKRARREVGGKAVKRYTREQLESVIQASDAELAKGLKERNIVELDGRMLFLPAEKLSPLLSVLLMILIIYAPQSSYSDPSKASAPADKVSEDLFESRGVSASLGEAILNLFGGIERTEGDLSGVWKADVPGMVREIGRGLLEGLGGKTVDKDAFMNKWRSAIGDTWGSLADLQLLEGNYILIPPTAVAARSAASPELKPFFVHQLPLHAATRFAELFLVRPRWRAEEMGPFLSGLTREGDTKERDKLVAKFVRVVKEPGDGVWWYPRRTG